MHLPHIHDLWIAPELERRRSAGLAAPTRIWRFLIRLPEDGCAPIVDRGAPAY